MTIPDPTLSPPPAPPSRVAVFPHSLPHLRLAVCTACWWTSRAERSAPRTEQLAAVHEGECTGAPTGLDPVQEARGRRIYARYVESICT